MERPMGFLFVGGIIFFSSKYPLKKLWKNLVLCGIKRKNYERTSKKIVETIADQIVNRVLERVEQSSQSINVNNVGTKLYTTKQLCEMLHISKAKLYRHREQGYLRPTKYVGRTPLYDQTAIDAYLNNFSY